MHALGKLLAVSFLVLPPAISSAQTYSIMDLAPGSGFDDALAYGISQNGMITGVGTVSATGELHAFIYSGGAFQDLGTLGYPYGADGVAINSSGQVAATGYGPGYHALLYSNGHVTRLGSIDGGSSEGLAINSLGHIVGRAQNGDGGYQGFTYFGSFAALSVDTARGLNDSDQVVGSVGYYWTYGGYVHGVEHAFVLTGSSLVDIGNLGGGLRTSTEAYAINNTGQVTGYSTTADGSIHAFRYTAGTMADLGTFPPYYTYGISINAGGDVAGNIETYVGGQVGAFLYSGGALHNLADLLGPGGAAWSQLIVTHMNDSGWIVGYGAINGGTHGFLARPVPPCPVDFNGDGQVNIADFLAFLAAYAAADPRADFNSSGGIDVSDFLAFLSAYAAGCP
jgi:probable HAF family extracellular repeat protein